jgi:hypothetical protein
MMRRPSFGWRSTRREILGYARFAGEAGDLVGIEALPGLSLFPADQEVGGTPPPAAHGQGVFGGGHEADLAQVDGTGLGTGLVAVGDLQRPGGGKAVLAPGSRPLRRWSDPEWGLSWSVA